MDKIDKSLGKLNVKEKKIVKTVLVKIKDQDFYGLDLKQLKGYKNIFRVRKNSLRIIFTKDIKNTKILAIERRSEKTYRF